MFATPFTVNPINGKIYRHPVLLQDGTVEELWEAQKKGEFNYIRFKQLEDHIWNSIQDRDDLLPDRYVSDKSAEQAVIDYLLNPAKTFRNVEKRKSFSLRKLEETPVISLTREKRLTPEEDGYVSNVWRLLEDCSKPDVQEIILYLWRRMEYEDLETKESVDCLTLFLSLTIRSRSLAPELLEAIQLQIKRRWGELELFSEAVACLVEKIDDPISFWESSDNGFDVSFFLGVFLAKVNWEKRLDLVTFLFDQSPNIFETKSFGDWYLSSIVKDNPLFEDFFHIVPKIDRKRIHVSEETLKVLFSSNSRWNITVILTKLIRQCRVQKSDLLKIFVKKVEKLSSSYSYLTEPGVEPHVDIDKKPCPKGSECVEHSGMNRYASSRAYIGIGDVTSGRNLSRREVEKILVTYEPLGKLTSDQLCSLREWIMDIPDNLFYSSSSSNSSSSSSC